MQFTTPRLPLARMVLAVALLASTSIAALAQDDKVVATVDGAQITEADISLAVSELDQQFAQLTPEQKRAAALSAIIEIKIMSNKAKTAGYDQDAEFKRKLEFLNQRALHAEVIEKEITPAITEEAIKARYEKEIAGQPQVEEVRARHILVKTKEEADEIIKQLDAGGDFEAIAKEKSSDTGSGAQGGDLGFFAAGMMVPEFEAAAFALDVGAYTKTPVQSQFGFHVIKLEEKRKREPVKFDDVKEQIRQLLFRDTYFAKVKETRAAAKIEITDPALKEGVEKIEMQASQPAEEVGPE
jgi:peptidyl-prolyl cis-trans isomerase C